jgi:hypothetical protein
MKHTLTVGERRTSSKEAEAKVQVEIVENLEYQDRNTLQVYLSHLGRGGAAETTYLWVFAMSMSGIKPSINLAGEAHHTSYHLAHSFLFDDGSGCILLGVAYGRILEEVVRAGSHPLVLDGSPSDPCWGSHQRDVHNIREGVRMKKASVQEASSKTVVGGSRWYSQQGHSDSPPQEQGANNSRLKHQVQE